MELEYPVCLCVRKVSLGAVFWTSWHWGTADLLEDLEELNDRLGSQNRIKVGRDLRDGLGSRRELLVHLTDLSWLMAATVTSLSVMLFR